MNNTMGNFERFDLSGVASTVKRGDVLGVYAFGSAGVITAAAAFYAAYTLLSGGSLGFLISVILLAISVPVSTLSWYTVFTSFGKYPIEILVRNDGFDVRFGDNSTWRYQWAGSSKVLEIWDYRILRGRPSAAPLYLVGKRSRLVPITEAAFNAITSRANASGVREQARTLLPGTPSNMVVHTLTPPTN